MKALSIRQPFAFYVVAGTKTQSGGKTTADRWILSESFGIVPSTLKSTPPNLGLTGQALSNDQRESHPQLKRKWGYPQIHDCWNSLINWWPQKSLF